MTRDSVESSLPETIRRIGRLEIRARQIVEGFLSGMHRSPYFGRSLEFREHRQYTTGDDLRHVDWKVWARQDRYYVKQYEEDTNLRGSLLVDCSRSMAYGGSNAGVERMSKYEYATTAASVIAYLLLRQNDAVSCLAFDSKIARETPSRSSRAHLNTIAEILSGEPTAQDTDLGSILSHAASALPRRGVVFLISDLMSDAEGLRTGLAQLRRRGHDVMVLQILDDDELEFPFDSATRFVGLESDNELTCNPRALRDGYLTAMQQFLDRTRRICQTAHAEYALVKTSDPFDAVLTALLSSRMKQK